MLVLLPISEALILRRRSEPDAPISLWVGIGIGIAIAIDHLPAASRDVETR